MNTNFNQGSAKIYQFPAGGRGHRKDETSSAADQAPRTASEAACSDSWYHEAAIQESKRER